MPEYVDLRGNRRFKLEWKTLLKYWAVREERYDSRKGGPPSYAEELAIRAYRLREIAAIGNEEDRYAAAEYLDETYPAQLERKKKR